MFVAFVNLHPNEYGVNKSCIRSQRKGSKEKEARSKKFKFGATALFGGKKRLKRPLFVVFLKRKEIVELKRTQVLVFGGQKDPVLARSYSFVLKRSQLTTSSGSGSDVSPERLLFLSFVEQILLEKALPFVLE